MRRSSPVATGCFLALLVLIVVLGKAGQKWQDFVRGDRNAHRPDSTLITNFRIHRPDLERLVDMARQDNRIGSVSIDQTGTDFLPPARVEDYRTLLLRVGAKHGLSRRRDGSVYITMNERHVLNTGSSKGFLYSMTPPDPIVPSLDNPPRTPQGTLYRHLDGPWYLYYEWGSD